MISQEESEVEVKVRTNLFILYEDGSCESFFSDDTSLVQFKNHGRLIRNILISQNGSQHPNSIGRCGKIINFKL
jgi:hypothetical protein